MAALASTIRTLLGSSAAALLAVGPMAARGQEASGAEVGGIEDIVVTARRHAESIQAVPVQISAFTTAQIEARDLASLEKIATTTPQFIIGRAANGSGAQFFMRGIGTSAISIGMEQSVAVVVDNVYYGHGRVTDEGLMDVERIEILRGPQALFFGKNATAGVISVTTADPGVEAEYKVRAGYEFTAEQTYGEVVASTPINDTLGIRVALHGSKSFGGLFKNKAQSTNFSFFDLGTGNVVPVGVGAVGDRDLPGNKDFMGRLTLKWKPNDQLTGTLKVSGTIADNKDPGSNYMPYDCPSGTSALNPNAPCSKKDFNVYHTGMPSEIAAAGFPHSGDAGELFNRYRSYSLSGNLDYDLGSMTVTSTTNYNWNHNTYNYQGEFVSNTVSPTWATEDTTFDAFSQELRARTNFDGPINLLIGGYYQHTKRDFGQFIVLAGLMDSRKPAPYQYMAFDKISASKGETASGYGQVLWTVAPTVELTAGVRYTHETKDSWFRHEHVFDALAASFVPYDPNNTATMINAKQTFTNWSPDATLTWRPSEKLTVYGAYKTAYKSGGFSNSGTLSSFTPDPVDAITFDPERAKGFEAGVKSTLADNQLRLNVGLYTYKYSDMQVEYFDSVAIALNSLNAGSAKTKGVEVEIEYAPNAVEGLTFRGSASFNHARYGNFAVVCNPGQGPAEGCNPVGPTGPFQNLKGRPTAMAPDFAATIGIGYETSMANGWLIGGSVDARYSDSYYASSLLSPGSINDSYVTLDAALRLVSASGEWEFALIGRNLTDELYITGELDGPFTGGAAGVSGTPADNYGYAAPPRTVQAQVTWRH